MALELSEPQSSLGAFLRTLRTRIDPESRTLGPYERSLTRHRRRVTQEEIAEIVGVSRGWYKLLESGGGAHASAALLDRLAQALTLTDEERTALFRLAVPEIANLQLRADSHAILEAFSWMRTAAKHVWVASSVHEAYVEAAERIADRFDDALMVHWMHRDDAGAWKRERTASNAWKYCSEIFESIVGSLEPEQIDNYMLYPELREAGEVGGSELLLPATQRARTAVYSRYSLDPPDFILARVRTREDRIGGFIVMHERGHAYSETDRAALGAIAELTSLALS